MISKYIAALIILFIAPCLCAAEPSLEEIKAEFKHKNLEGRLAAMQQLQGRGDEETVNFLMAVTGNGLENWQVKIRAIELLGKAGNSKALDLLLGIFASQSLHYSCPAIKTSTAIALGNFRRNNKVRDMLIRGIQSDEPQVREASVQSLGKIGDEGAVPHLIPLLGDYSIAIRLSAIYALAGLSGPQVVPHLKTVSEKDGDEIVRNAAKSVLTNYYGKKNGN